MEQTLGKRIAAHRKGLGMTQDALAEKLGVTAQAVSKWENDQSCPDIAILPKLAEIFGTTTDELLGIVQESKALESTVVENNGEQDDGSFQFRNGNWVFKYDNSRRGGIFFAIFVLFVGGAYLLSSLFHLDIGLWDIVWPSALLVWGIHSMRPKFSFFGLGCIIFGGFFLVNNFVPVQVQLDSGVIVAIIILLFGGSLLMDALGKPRKPMIEFTYNNGSNDKSPENNFAIQGEKFQYDASFGDHSQRVSMSRLQYGLINTSFGDYDIDLSEVEEIADDCRMEANTSFGDLTILVPKKYRVQCTSSTAFASIEVEGRPDPEPAGSISLTANANFGQITVKYI